MIDIAKSQIYTCKNKQNR